MSLSDPIGDMIARVKNAQARNHKKVDLPSSNFKSKIADILKNEGFIKDFKISSEDNKPTLSLELKYHSGNPVISAFERVSKPGRRIFSSAEGLPKINNGLGIAIVSTPKGVMTDIDARKQRVGGEIICIQIISPPTRCFLASISVITPFGVETIAIPRPLLILGKPSALEKILLPGLETLSNALITGLPEWYLSSKDNVGLLSSELILKSFIKPSFFSISAIFDLKFDDGRSTFLWFLAWAFLTLAIISPIGSLKLIIFLPTSST